MIGADREQRDLGLASFANIFEPIEISTVSRVINPAALMFEDKPSVTAMIVAQYPCPPVLARRQSYLPIPMREAFPPLQFHDPSKAQVISQIADAPRHHLDVC